MGMLFVCWVSKTKNTIPTLIQKHRGEPETLQGKEQAPPVN